MDFSRLLNLIYFVALCVAVLQYVYVFTSVKFCSILRNDRNLSNVGWENSIPSCWNVLCQTSTKLVLLESPNAEKNLDENRQMIFYGFPESWTSILFLFSLDEVLTFRVFWNFWNSVFQVVKQLNKKVDFNRLKKTTHCKNWAHFLLKCADWKLMTLCAHCKQLAWSISDRSLGGALNVPCISMPFLVCLQNVKVSLYGET